MKNLFVTTVATLALATSGAFASTAPKHVGQSNIVLWNQNSNFGPGIVSDNFSSAMSSYSSIGADDFYVPAGQKWWISEVDVTGAYTTGSGPASSEVVTFWTGPIGPHKIAQRGADTFELSCTDSNGSFACILPLNAHGRPVVRLPGGSAGRRYLLTVVANCDFTTCGEWDWMTSTTVHNSQAFWKNPGGGWMNSCRGWGTLQSCFNLPPTDFAFALIGYSKGS